MKTSKKWKFIFAGVGVGSVLPILTVATSCSSKPEVVLPTYDILLASDSVRQSVATYPVSITDGSELVAFEGQGAERQYVYQLYQTLDNNIQTYDSEISWVIKTEQTTNTLSQNAITGWDGWGEVWINSLGQLNVRISEWNPNMLDKDVFEETFIATFDGQTKEITIKLFSYSAYPTQGQLTTTDLSGIKQQVFINDVGFIADFSLILNPVNYSNKVYNFFDYFKINFYTQTEAGQNQELVLSKTIIKNIESEIIIVNTDSENNTLNVFDPFIINNLTETNFTLSYNPESVENNEFVSFIFEIVPINQDTPYTKITGFPYPENNKINKYQLEFRKVV